MLKIFLVLWLCLTYREGFTQSLFVGAGDKHISYEGRIRMTKDVVELIWPGTSVRIDFEGTGLSGELKDQDTSNYYNI
ncbi:MAG TPA: hypothetical protein VGQ51_15190, partial [Puia sp.]|nr:hypothetical protein [Puia sp.]